MKTDEETGETENSLQFPFNDFDLETGESNPECGQHKDPFCFKKTSSFHVPKCCLEDSSRNISTRKSRSCISKNRTYYVANKKAVINLKQEIILGYNKTSHRMFFIPSFFMFPQLAGITLVVIEILLHIWAHRKNSKNTNDSIYYRSPLHILTSQFCGKCRQVTTMEKVYELHRKQLRKNRLLRQKSDKVTKESG